MPQPALILSALVLRVLAARLPDEDDRQRGDIPGWVLITVMSAALVTVIWAVAEPQLRTLLTNALGSVSGLGGG